MPWNLVHIQDRHKLGVPGPAQNLLKESQPSGRKPSPALIFEQPWPIHRQADGVETPLGDRFEIALLDENNNMLIGKVGLGKPAAQVETDRTDEDRRNHGSSCGD